MYQIHSLTRKTNINCNNGDYFLTFSRLGIHQCTINVYSMVKRLQGVTIIVTKLICPTINDGASLGVDILL
jgi:hypothetical protein